MKIKKKPKMGGEGKEATGKGWRSQRRMKNIKKAKEEDGEGKEVNKWDESEHTKEVGFGRPSSEGSQRRWLKKAKKPKKKDGEHKKAKQWGMKKINKL